jgi:hypothetical protein
VNELTVPHAVEIFRDGRIFAASMADLLPGDCFCKADNTGRWFKCLGPVRASVYHGATTYIVAGLEVLQAAPIVDTAPALPAPEKIVANGIEVYLP